MLFIFKLRHKGFTLTELIVSMGIAIGILTVVVMNQSAYIDGATLRNAAEGIGLSLQEAQVYGISVKEFSAGSAEFSAAYGIDLDIRSAATNNFYILFGDRGARNQIYDSGSTCPIGGTSECIEKVTLSTGYTISALCQIPNSGADICNVGRASVTFLRPEPEARIVYFDMAGNVLSASGIKGLRIRVVSPRGSARSVVVYKTGQVSIE